MLRVLFCLETQHDWRLVLLAGFVCLLTGLTAINLFHRARVASGRSCAIWILTAGMVTGCGIWATHFIAMLAYMPGFAIKYDLSLTALSLLIAAVLTTAGLVIALFGGARWGGVAGGGLVGVGIACMHYLGMAALIVPGEIVWQPSLVAVSVILGIMLGAASLAVARRNDKPLTIGCAAGLLSLAIVSHHFVAMGAIGLIPNSLASSDNNLLSPVALSLAVAAVAAALVFGGLIGAMSDRRNRSRINERNMQLDAALNNMGQGLCMFGPDNRLQLWNELYLAMYRIPPAEIYVGCTPENLFAAREAAGTIFRDLRQHRDTLLTAIDKRAPSTRVAELVDGRTISVTYQPMQNGGWVATHEDITERKASEARIAHLAHHDLLTDLPNRAAFNEHLTRTFEEASTRQGTFAILCLDLDRFKEVNDVFGQSTGDSLLCEVARRLREACNGAFIARLGGDEFTVISSAGVQPATAEDICARLAAVFETEFQINDQSIRASCTIGVGIYPQDSTDLETLIANAEATLTRAKAEARGTIRFFEPAMDQQIREKRILQRDLITAVARQEFELYYQPQASAGGDIVAFEVLVRWHHPERGMISPGVFIPLAEETGLIAPIDEWILREACREAATWPKPLAIAVNLSPIDFRHGDLPGMIHSILLETGLSPRRLEIEITEGVLIEDFNRATAILRRIKNLGVRIAMDDFGTGYSSLSYLQSFPFDKIKIDQTFIARIETSVQSAAIVRAIIGLGRGLDLPVIAEGVETNRQLVFLTEEGCNEIQGYLIGRPQPIAHYRHVVDPAAASHPVAIAS